MYDHDIAVDWAQSVMAIARTTLKGRKLEVVESKADIGDLKAYLKSLQGSKRLVVEESTSSQWIYVELRSFVDKIIVCDPRRNRLLSEGPKTDKIDARKLLDLMRADLLKEVHHSTHEFIYMRQLASGYQDLIRAGVRLKNQRSALLRAFGKDKSEIAVEETAAEFVLEGQDRGISAYEREKVRYESEFARLCKRYKVLRNLATCPGIGKMGAVQIGSAVVDPRRFPSRGKFLAYCGLVKYERISGGKSYGKVRANYNRSLKNIFKMAAMACINASENNPLRQRYEFLIRDKRLPTHHARHAIARQAAVIAWGVMKNNQKFDINKRRKEQSQKR